MIFNTSYPGLKYHYNALPEEQAADFVTVQTCLVFNCGKFAIIKNGAIRQRQSF